MSGFGVPARAQAGNSRAVVAGRGTTIDGVRRPAPGRTVALLAGALVVTVAAGAAHAGSVPAALGAPAAVESTPLQVSMDSLTPSAIPDEGRIRVTGQITNASDDVWRDLNVYLLTSAAPFTTSRELVAAQGTDPASEIGARLTAAELYDPVGELQPGSSVGYTLNVPREDLEISGDPGVYWLGVHVLGADQDGGRDSVADGRARTFVPLMQDEKRAPSTSIAMVMPVKADVRRTANGRLRDLTSWHELLSEEGRLGRLLALSGTSGTLSLTWVVDPAVLDAVNTVAADNPRRSIARTGAGSDGADQGESPPGQDEGQGEEQGQDDEQGGEVEEEPAEPNVAPTAQALEAAGWLDTFRRQAAQHTVLTVPYGDMDVAAALRLGFGGLYERATELSATTMTEQDIDAEAVVAPTTGLLPRAVFPRLDPDTAVLLSDAAIPAATGPVVEPTDRGHRVVLADASARRGGPAPTPPFQALALRQRILGEAAVHALSADRDQPLVVSTPQLWDPGSDWRRAAFFEGLQVPWLRTVDLPDVAATGAPSTTASSDLDLVIAYPESEAKAELSIANPLAAQELDDTGRVYAGLLNQNDTIDNDLSKAAMLAAGVRARAHPNASVETARTATAKVRTVMEQVRIEGPSFVTLSSGEGTFAITLVNDLDQPVTVGVQATTGTTELEIPSPDPVSLGPGQRASVRLRATANDIGVHAVSLVPTNRNGATLGNATRFNVRSSQVGLVIWAVMGVGALILFGAIAVRLVRRFRTHRRSGDRLDPSSGPTGPPAQEPAASNV